MQVVRGPFQLSAHIHLTSWIINLVPPLVHGVGNQCGPHTTGWMSLPCFPPPVTVRVSGGVWRLPPTPFDGWGFLSGFYPRPLSRIHAFGVYGSLRPVTKFGQGLPPFSAACCWGVCLPAQERPDGGGSPCAWASIYMGVCLVVHPLG